MVLDRDKTPMQSAAGGAAAKLIEFPPKDFCPSLAGPAASSLDNGDIIEDLVVENRVNILSNLI